MNHAAMFAVLFALSSIFGSALMAAHAVLGQSTTFDSNWAAWCAVVAAICAGFAFKSGHG